MLNDDRLHDSAGSLDLFLTKPKRNDLQLNSPGRPKLVLSPLNVVTNDPLHQSIADDVLARPIP